MNTIPVLQGKWMAAELHGDAFRSGALRYDDVDWSDVDVRTYGDAAVAIGQWTQRGEHQGNSVDGRFRVTQVLVRTHGEWSLGGLHLSPIATPC